MLEVGSLVMKLWPGAGSCLRNLPLAGKVVFKCDSVSAQGVPVTSEGSPGLWGLIGQGAVCSQPYRAFSSLLVILDTEILLQQPRGWIFQENQEEGGGPVSDDRCVHCLPWPSGKTGQEVAKGPEKPSTVGIK